jgi:hypothetical protein
LTLKREINLSNLEGTINLRKFWALIFFFENDIQKERKSIEFHLKI